MEGIIKILTFCGLVYLGYYLDKQLIELIIKEIPSSANEWLKIISLALWCVAVFFTGGLILGLSAVISGFVSVFFR